MFQVIADDEPFTRMDRTHGGCEICKDQEQGNRYLCEWSKEMQKVTSLYPIERIFDPSLEEDRRQPMFEWFDETVQESMRQRYSFAVPTHQVLQLLTQFSPIVEIGAGNGYWSHLLGLHGAVVHAYDLSPPPPSLQFAPVSSGGPDRLQAHPESTLFLCWPDESSMALECIKRYQGEYLLYIGEGLGRTLHSDFGLTGDVSFHIHLANRFHEIVRVPLPNWPGTMDCLSVYKRTQSCSFSCTCPDDESSTKIQRYSHIPASERMNVLGVSSFAADKFHF